MLPLYDGLDSGGDGTVPRVSATPIELADQGREIYAPDQHGSLQNAAGPLTQLIGVLSARPTANLRGGISGFGLQIDEIFDVDEPIMATVTSDDPSPTVDAAIVDVATGRHGTGIPNRGRRRRGVSGRVASSTVGRLPADGFAAGQRP